MRLGVSKNITLLHKYKELIEERRGEFALCRFPRIITEHTVTKQGDTALSSIFTGNFIMEVSDLSY
jgi:hypothetical protein